MSHPGLEHWKALGYIIGYLKGKNKEGIIIRKPKVLKAVMFWDSNYATDKETINIVINLAATLGLSLLTCSLETHRTVTLRSIETEYMVLLVCAQEVKFVKMLLRRNDWSTKTISCIQRESSRNFTSKKKC